jgi:predicted dehydrogenase
VVGVGAMGRRHCRVIHSLGDRFELVGGYDTRLDADLPEGISRLASEAEAIALADVVIVATPIEAHAAVVARALEAGRSVLVEKPLCRTASEANALVATAAAAGRASCLFVSHTERFNPVVRALARLLRGDRVRQMEFRRIGFSKPSGTGALVNLGVHDIDLGAYLGGGDVSLRAATGGGSGVAGEDYAHLLFSTSAGAVGHLYVDRTAAAKQRVLEVSTERWLYEGDLLAQRLSRTPRSLRAARAGAPKASRTDVPLLLDEPLLVQAIALADALDGGSVREIATGTDGARAVHIAERAAAQCARVPEVAKPEAFGR